MDGGPAADALEDPPDDLGVDHVTSPVAPDPERLAGAERDRASGSHSSQASASSASPAATAAPAAGRRGSVEVANRPEPLRRLGGRWSRLGRLVAPDGGVGREAHLEQGRGRPVDHTPRDEELGERPLDPLGQVGLVGPQQGRGGPVVDQAGWRASRATARACSRGRLRSVKISRLSRRIPDATS